MWLDSASKIEMLGVNQALNWKNVPEGKYGRGGKVVVQIPESLKSTFQSAPAVTLKIEIAG